MKRVYFITDVVKGKKRFEFAHCYNKHIIASTRQGYSRLKDCQDAYHNNFKPGAKEINCTRQEFNRLFKKK